ncbi:MAG: hypothetical protein K2G94_04215, partial [Muribaculaceae bacterium]|nr:hypothetical protein [Muribaculaceae bacterium]
VSCAAVWLRDRVAYALAGSWPTDTVLPVTIFSSKAGIARCSVSGLCKFIAAGHETNEFFSLHLRYQNIKQKNHYDF